VGDSLSRRGPGSGTRQYECIRNASRSKISQLPSTKAAKGCTTAHRVGKFPRHRRHLTYVIAIRVPASAEARGCPDAGFASEGFDDSASSKLCLQERSFQSPIPRSTKNTAAITHSRPTILRLERVVHREPPAQEHATTRIDISVSGLPASAIVSSNQLYAGERNHRPVTNTIR